jgi:uncharacterized protein YukE
MTEVWMAEVSMDYDVVQQMADDFNDAAETLRAVSNALGVAVAILKATAMLGLVGNGALAFYLEAIKPHVDDLAETCDELNRNLIGAIASLRDGDTSGSQRFV